MATEKRLDLIDRSAYLKEYWNGVNSDELRTFQDIYRSISNAPTVDAVEVVRCKDCLYWEEYDGEMFCLCNVNLMTDTAADDFCSYGERRADG